MSLSPFRGGKPPPRTFNPEQDIPDLSGKVVLVTGGNAGIGAATVRALVPHNPTIYLCARNISSAEALVDEIKQKQPKANITILKLDLGSFDSIKACAHAFNTQADRLDILFLNAGISATAPTVTQEGYEQQFGVNHMGHALLTQLLLPKMLHTLRRQPDADLRIHVTASIGAHVFAPKEGLKLEDMHKPDALSHGMSRYGHSKLANILFARKLAQQYPHITSTSSHPGTVRSEIWARADGMKLMVLLLAPVVWWTGVTTDEGAKTQLWCATAPLSDGIDNGRYYEPIGIEATGKSENAMRQDLADALWQWTTEELGKHGAPGWPQA
ncbi:hypothetical protein BAUCODRAFT_38107 [Baudoinia panamericana UAMH 10762]|uniref:Oxidoreductase n=1 Tax=Baudoinia panamericana (strain UAMH 10762) TaxID=717646 RepID=M2ML43_BAUPA|nr:uncharacterized protein BAUCODRAFT_38107 [Baudoinia panamericana UAMH 10762]EMC92078.1 hypothetical protein BAUCODRAFT_38107 [Baudoinia panamericana UAMH 10762]